MSTALFLYGTLCHDPLLRIVLGREADAEPALLADHKVTWVADEPFPLIRHEPGAEARGRVLTDLSDEDLARLDFYEGGFGYGTVPVRVTTDHGPVAAHVYMPDTDAYVSGADWSLEDWVGDWGALSCRAAEEAMSYFGRKTPEEIAWMFPMIRTRADAWLAGRAEDRSAGGLSMPQATPVRQVALRRPYAHFFAIEEHDLLVPRFGGRPPVEVSRAVFMGGDAALVLPYDPVGDRVLLIEQFRAAPYARGEAAPWTLEPVAGRIDPGESAEEAAHREGMEEAGLTFRQLVPVSKCYPSPGSSTEYYHIFTGLTDLPESTDHIGGVAGEGEDIRSHILPAERFIEMCDTDRIWVAPLVLLGHWLARHRDRLRAARS